MGLFSNSFKRELGRNSAKWLSNKVLGDKWSTPHKVIIKRDQAPIKQTPVKTPAKKAGFWDFMIELVKK